MCSEARPEPHRPKIELVRVSSSERAKIPVNPVQLNLVYRHVRSATYARPGTKPLSPPDAAPYHHYHYHHHHHYHHYHHHPSNTTTTTTTSTTTTTRRPRWLWAPWRSHSSTGPLSCTKSCDDLNRVSGAAHSAASRSEGCLLTLLLTPRSGASPHSGAKYRLWRGFSRSSRDVSVLPTPNPPRTAVSLTLMDRLTPRPARPVRHKASTLPYSAASGPQPAARRQRGLVALLRRLSPRIKRSPSPERPWVTVEPRPPDRSSIASDHSFEAALQSRCPDLLAPPRATPAHTTNETAGKGGEGGRSSRSGLSSLLTSLKSTRSPRHEKHASHDSTGKTRHDQRRPRHSVRPPTATAPPEQRVAEGDAVSHPAAAEPPVPATLVPTLQLIHSQVDSRAATDLSTTLSSLQISTRPTVTVQRPHTLNLPTRAHTRVGWTADPGLPPHPPPPSPLPLSSLPPQMSQSLHTQTTSVDSIGSCSLDVNATGTTTPATMVLDGSEHSLRSVSLEHKLSEVGDSDVVTPTRPILRPQPFTDPGPPPRDSFKTPSYLGISCAVNGYNRLNRYDSTLREGFRSRDASPARLAFSRSRDSSPMRPEWKGFDYRTKVSPQATAAKIKELKEELARFKEEFPHPPGERGRQNISKRLGRRPSQGRSISVDRGYLTKSTSQGTMNGLDTPIASPGRIVEITMTDKSSVKSSSYQYSYEERTVRSNGSETTSTYTCTTHANGDTPDKSFIQSRIERLYGPGALGSGFRSRRSLLELEKEQKDREAAGHRSPLIAPHSDSHYDPDAQAPEGFPSVFRHLRPEFRTQLQVKRNSGTPKTCLSPQPLSPSQVESPKRPGRVIPITLTDTCERKPSKPPVTPKPELPISNDIQRSNVTRRESKPMVVQKIVNGNGNIEEIEVTVDKEPSVNGSVEHKVSEDKVLEDSVVRTSKVNGVPESVKVNGIVSEDVEQKDGHYFLKIVDEVIREIEQKVAQIESYLEASGSEMSEEVKGKVLAAVGKARLLISQKIQQFQGLCHKNINTSADEEFPTTCEDLAGFWDMVSIQVEDIRQSLKEIETLRSNNWQERVGTDTIDGAEVVVSTGKARRKPAPRPSRPARSTKASVEKSEEGKTRDEARRKMIEERRKAMKEAMKAKKAEAEAKKGEAGEDAVEIFIPEGK
ncbi:uncharacterized protein LOC135115102 isoform X2 [Scylla paramamosain]|uniref:uncharacterized protein LOC135115102 isoform X2 n=1 Tax=Scylla paramamosain TaxID=85552 RepID=UPI00308309C4